MQTIKLSAKNLYVYHYAQTPEAFEHIKTEGLCAPGKLVGTEAFAGIIDNYAARIKAVFKGQITDEIVLDYLDYSRALIMDQFQAGRNMIFCMFSPIPAGISPAHDRFRKHPLVKVNLTKLIKDEKAKIFVVELPGKSPDDNTSEISLDDVETFQNADLMSFYSKKTSEGLLFGNVPHLAIWIKSGQIDKKYLSY